MVTAELKNDGQVIAVVSVPSKEFKTGSRGFYTNGKVEVNGKRYQMSVQLVEIGSKGTSPPASDPNVTVVKSPNSTMIELESINGKTMTEIAAELTAQRKVENAAK
jgi:hypothetical protein